MAKDPEKRILAREEEIVNACEELYKTMSFKEITIKEIGNATSFTRTSIYNYFETKEEIFLTLIKREYNLWIAELKELLQSNEELSKETFASKFAKTLENRELLHKLMSMNHYDMEANTRPERLTEFKVVYGESLRTVNTCLEKFFPDMSIAEKQNFIYVFFPFMFGIYPYTVVNEKQRVAMGAWAWGDTDGYFGNTMKGEEFRPIFDKSLELGLNLWDTATAYSNGESEKILGGFVNAVGKENVIVSTKFTSQMAAMYDNSVQKMCDASLARMGLDYIDIYWIHNPIGAPEYTKQLIPLLKSGKVKSVGVSNHNLTQIKEADAILKEAGYSVSAVQNHFSLMNRSSADSGILDYCKENGIVFYGYMTLEQGALSGKYDATHPFPAGSTRAQVFNPLLDKIEIITAEMKKVAEFHGVSVAQIGTAYAVAKGVLPIIGVTKMYQVEEAAQTADIVLTDAEIAGLEATADKAGVESVQFWESKME